MGFGVLQTVFPVQGSMHVDIVRMHVFDLQRLDLPQPHPGAGTQQVGSIADRIGPQFAALLHIKEHFYFWEG